MQNKNLLYIGLGIGAIYILKNVVYKSVVKPAIENIDKGMDKTADFYVKKEMAWNEFWNNSDTMKERYDNFLIYLGFEDG